MQLSIFRGLIMGHKKAKQKSFYQKSVSIPPINTTRYNMLCLYIYTLAQRFEISDEEHMASVRRAERARILSSTRGDLSLLPTPADLESAAWRKRSVRTVRGIPWSIREHVFTYAYSATLWKTTFVADRLARNVIVEKQQMFRLRHCV